MIIRSGKLYEICENITLEELDFELVRMRAIDCFNFVSWRQ